MNLELIKNLEVKKNLELINLRYVITIYSKLSFKQKKKITIFLKNNFNENISNKLSKNIFDFEPTTIIILNLIENNIIGCICLFDNKHLLEKIDLNNVPLNYYVFTAENNGCFIYNLCVDRDYRNNKIGYNLIKYAIKQMIKLRIIYLHTHAENEIARNIFINNGFTEFNSFINSNNAKIYIMHKYLESE
jgi:ribosomal protein S18 acetylase RimI-like enzyme